MPRLLVTADLHYNHPRSRALADEFIEEVNRVQGADALLLVGDTAGSEPGLLEECLARFRFDGPKLFVAGNHELWTQGGDSYRLFKNELPARVRSAGWRWLQDEPFVMDDVAIVGSIGWYDYSFAPEHLNIPRRFYERKIAPGSALQTPELAHLIGDDVPADSREIFARWNDAKFVNLGRSDQVFLDELLYQLESQLRALEHVPQVIAAIHHLPFAQLAPQIRGAHWEFARAFLGSSRIGELLQRFPNVNQSISGHSHFEMQTQVGAIRAMSLGSGYRQKSYKLVEI